MGKSIDQKYIVKELNDDDHSGLLHSAARYAEHITCGQGSLIIRIYAHCEQDGVR